MIRISDEWGKYNGGERNGEEAFVDFIECVKAICAKDAEIRIDSSFYTLILVVCGSVRVDGDGYCVKKGESVLLPRFARLRMSADETTEIIRIIFDMSEGLVNTGKRNAVYMVIPEASGKIDRLYNADKFEASVLGLREAILIDVLNDIYRYTNSTPAELSLYNKICQWIFENAHRAITAKSVAEALSYSREYLNRVIRAVDGISLSEKIASYRMEKIRTLSKSGLSAEDIAKQLDFYSAEHLCKYVKYHAGVSLRRFRGGIN